MASGGSWSAPEAIAWPTGLPIEAETKPGALLFGVAPAIRVCVTFRDALDLRWVKYADSFGLNSYDGNEATLFRRGEYTMNAAGIVGEFGEVFPDLADNTGHWDLLSTDPLRNASARVERVKSVAAEPERLRMLLNGVEPIVTEIERMLDSGRLPSEATAALEANRNVLTSVIRDPDPSPAVIEGALVRIAQVLAIYSDEPERLAAKARTAGAEESLAESIRDFARDALNAAANLNVEAEDGDLTTFEAFLADNTVRVRVCISRAG